MAERTLTSHIEAPPGVCGGKPRIAGTRIHVQDIMVWHELQGLSVDEIVTQYPQLTLADVHAALAYYHDHREEIRRHVKDAEDLVNAMLKDNPPRLVRKLTGTDVRDDSVSPG